MQLPTGGGKTHIFSEVAKSAETRGFRVWIVVPRNELLQQASNSLRSIGVSHGRIAAGVAESLAYKVHVVSKDTLIRRYDKIKRPPDLIIPDEAHLALERYIEIAEKFPDSKFLGTTATPERLDGRGLSELYNKLVLGPTIHELIEQGYLTNIRYFSPPIDGLKDVHRRGTDYDPKELEELLKRRRIYGEAISHYRRHADGKPCLVFCRSVQAAAETAQKFNDAGYLFENIDGTMTYGQRKVLIDALKNGQLNGLTSCELVTYGLDVPRVECIVMLRPTLSRALFMQMIGRGLRPFEGKKECVILDHVGNLQEHGHPLAPYEWKFFGTEKRKKKKRENEAIVKLCPEIDFLYCEKRSCIGCEHNKSGRKKRDLEQIDGELTETEAPVKLNARPFEERREFQDKIGKIVDDFKGGESEGLILTGPIGELLRIAKALGRKPMWAYHQLSRDRVSINVPLLHEIARQKKYKSGWAHYQAKNLRGEQ
jgi:superfamily II DNA or RNA helicase